MSLILGENLLNEYNKRKNTQDGSLNNVERTALGTWSYVNKYDALYDKYNFNKNFNAQMWQDAFKYGDQDTFFTFVEANKDKELSKEFYDEQYYDYETMMLEMSSSVADNTDASRQERFKQQYDVVKNEWLDVSLGEMTDQEYINYQIDQAHKLKAEEIKRAQELKQKEALGWWGQFGNDIVATLAELGEGALSIVAGIVDFAVATGTFGLIPWAIEGGGDYGEAFVNYFGENGFTALEQNTIRAGLDEYERTHTHYKDIDGNTTDVGKWFASTANSIGMMIPAIVISACTAGIGGGILGSVAFYTGTFSKNMYEVDNNPLTAGSPAWLKITNSTMKVAAEAAIEFALGKLMGGTIQNSLIGISGKFKTGAVNALAKNLKTAGIKYLAKSAFQEGLEEFVQDFSTNLIDQFSDLVYKGYGNNGVTFQTLVDSFFMGVLCSVVTSGASVPMSAIKSGIINAKAKKSGKYNTDLGFGPGDVVIEVDGKPQKLRGFTKMAFNEVLSDLGKEIEGLSKNKFTEEKDFEKAKEVYTALMTLQQFYGSFDKKRIENCELLLGRVIEAERKLQNMPNMVSGVEGEQRIQSIMAERSTAETTDDTRTDREISEMNNVVPRMSSQSNTMNDTDLSVIGSRVMPNQDFDAVSTSTMPIGTGMTRNKFKYEQQIKVQKEVGKFNYVSSIAQQFKDMTGLVGERLAKKVEKSVEENKEKLQEAKVTEITAAKEGTENKPIDPKKINEGFYEKMGNKPLSNAAKDKLAVLADEFNIVLATDGNDIVVDDVEKIVYVPVDWLENYKSSEIYDTLVQSQVLDFFVSSKDKEMVAFRKDILEVVRKMKGKKTMSVTDALMEFLFNQSIFQYFILSKSGDTLNIHKHKTVLNIFYVLIEGKIQTSKWYKQLFKGNPSQKRINMTNKLLSKIKENIQIPILKAIVNFNMERTDFHADYILNDKQKEFLQELNRRKKEKTNFVSKGTVPSAWASTDDEIIRIAENYRLDEDIIEFLKKDPKTLSQDDRLTQFNIKRYLDRHNWNRDMPITLEGDIISQKKMYLEQRKRFRRHQGYLKLLFYMIQHDGEYVDLRDISDVFVSKEVKISKKTIASILEKELILVNDIISSNGDRLDSTGVKHMLNRLQSMRQLEDFSMQDIRNLVLDFLESDLIADAEHIVDLDKQLFSIYKEDRVWEQELMKARTEAAMIVPVYTFKDNKFSVDTELSNADRQMILDLFSEFEKEFGISVTDFLNTEWENEESKSLFVQQWLEERLSDDFMCIIGGTENDDYPFNARMIIKPVIAKKIPLSNLLKDDFVESIFFKGRLEQGEVVDASDIIKLPISTKIRMMMPSEYEKYPNGGGVYISHEDTILIRKMSIETLAHELNHAIAKPYIDVPSVIYGVNADICKHIYKYHKNLIRTLEWVKEIEHIDDFDNMIDTVNMYIEAKRHPDFSPKYTIENEQLFKKVKGKLIYIADVSTVTKYIDVLELYIDALYYLTDVEMNADMHIKDDAKKGAGYTIDYFSNRIITNRGDIIKYRGAEPMYYTSHEDKSSNYLLYSKSSSNDKLAPDFYQDEDYLFQFEEILRARKTGQTTDRFHHQLSIYSESTYELCKRILGTQCDIKAYDAAIDDIIKNPELYLNAEMLEELDGNYSEGNVYNRLKAFYESLEIGVSIDRRVFEDGTHKYDFVSDYAFDDTLRSDIKKKRSTKDSDLIQTSAKYIYNSLSDYYDADVLEDLNIPDIPVIVHKNVNTEFVDNDRFGTAITINANEIISNEEFLNRLNHEFRHYLQYRNDFEMGFTAAFKPSVEMMKDVKAHVPELFEDEDLRKMAENASDVRNGKKTWKEHLVSLFVYYLTHGEIQAYGIMPSLLFTKTIYVGKDGGKYYVYMPWYDAKTRKGRHEVTGFVSKHEEEGKIATNKVVIKSKEEIKAQFEIDEKVNQKRIEIMQDLIQNDEIFRKYRNDPIAIIDEKIARYNKRDRHSDDAKKIFNEWVHVKASYKRIDKDLSDYRESLVNPKKEEPKKTEPKKGEHYSGTFYHGSKFSMTNTAYDASKGKGFKNLGVGLYLTPDVKLAEKYGKHIIKLEAEFDNIFILTEEHITNIDDLYTAMGKDKPNNVSWKNIKSDLCNAQKGKGAERFTKKMRELGYAGVYSKGYGYVDPNAEQFVIYDETYLQNLTTQPYKDGVPEKTEPKKEEPKKTEPKKTESKETKIIVEPKKTERELLIDSLSEAEYNKYVQLSKDKFKSLTKKSPKDVDESINRLLKIDKEEGLTDIQKKNLEKLRLYKEELKKIRSFVKSYRTKLEKMTDTELNVIKNKEKYLLETGKSEFTVKGELVAANVVKEANKITDKSVREYVLSNKSLTAVKNSVHNSKKLSHEEKQARLKTIDTAIKEKERIQKLGREFATELDKKPADEIISLYKKSVQGLHFGAMLPSVESDKIKRNVFESRIYVSKIEYADTNMKYFFKDYDQVQMSKKLVDFIVATTGFENNLSKSLMQLIYDGALNQKRLSRWLSETEDLNDFTLQLLNEHIYKNSAIKDTKELELLISKSALFWAFGSELKTSGISFQEILFSTNDVADLIGTIEKLDPDMIKRMERKVDKFDLEYSKEIRTKAYALARNYFLKYFDGSPASAFRCANMIRKTMKDMNTHLSDDSLNRTITGGKGDDQEQELLERIEDPNANLEEQLMMKESAENANKLVKAITNYEGDDAVEKTIMAMAESKDRFPSTGEMISDLVFEYLSKSICKKFVNIAKSKWPDYMPKKLGKEILTALNSGNFDITDEEAPLNRIFAKIKDKIDDTTDIGAKQRDYLRALFKFLNKEFVELRTSAITHYGSLNEDVLRERYSKLELVQTIGEDVSTDMVATTKENVKKDEKSLSRKRRIIAASIKLYGDRLAKYLNDRIFLYKDLPEDIQALFDETPSSNKNGHPTYKLREDAYSVGRGIVKISNVDRTSTTRDNYKPIKDPTNDEQRMALRHNTDRIYKIADMLRIYVGEIDAQIRANRRETKKTIDRVENYQKKVEGKLAFAEARLAQANEKLEEARKFKQEFTIKKRKRQYESTDTPNNFVIGSDKEMPAVLKDIFDVSFDEFAYTKVQFASKDEKGNVFSKDDKNFVARFNHEVSNWNAFYDANYEKLSALTRTDVDRILDFFKSGITISFGGPINKFYAFTIFMLGYILDVTRMHPARWNFSTTEISEIEKYWENLASGIGSGLNAVSQMQSVINPFRKVEQRYFEDFNIPDTDVDNFFKAAEKLRTVKTKDERESAEKQLRKEISNMQKLMADHWMKERGWGKRAWSKINSFRYLSMLSSPFTWARNIVSDVIIEGNNNLADAIGSKIIRKGYREDLGQINLTKIKVSNDTAAYIKEHYLKETKYEGVGKNKRVVEEGAIFEGLLDGVGSRYDLNESDYAIKNGRKSSQRQLLIQIISSHLEQKFATENRWDNKIMKGVQTFIDKMISDKYFIKRAFSKYFGKILQYEIDKGNINLNDDPFGEKVLEVFTDALILANYDYMHKPNALSKLMRTLQETSPNTYKVVQIMFPFVSSGWNWFVESLKLSFPGLIASIVRWTRLEKEIEKVELARAANHKVPSPRYTEHLIRRDFGKGVIGTILSIGGIFLGVLGIIRIDDDDDKLYVYAGDNVKVDISSIFGSSSILVGAAIGQGFVKKGQTFDSVNGLLADYLLSGFFFFDTLETYQYGDDNWARSTAIFESYMKSFIPQMWQFIVRASNDKKIKYSPGILGGIERWVNSFAPLQPLGSRKTNIYTGKEETKYSWPVLGEFLKSGIFGPKIIYHEVTEQELFVEEYGLSKLELSGEITIDGKKYGINKAAVNKYYGELNKDTLLDLQKQTHYVQNENGTYSTLHWNKLTDKQRKTVIDRTMRKNADYAKIYVWTKSGGKYYASDSTFVALRQMGITKNVYRGDKGFVR